MIQIFCSLCLCRQTFNITPSNQLKQQQQSQQTNKQTISTLAPLLLLMLVSSLLLSCKCLNNLKVYMPSSSLFEFEFHNIRLLYYLIYIYIFISLYNYILFQLFQIYKSLLSCLIVTLGLSRHL